MQSTSNDAGRLGSPAIDQSPVAIPDGTAPEPERARLEEGAADRFRIDALIGRGLFSWVFQATEIRGAAEVAIKLLDADVTASAEVLERLRIEQRACAALGDTEVVAASSIEQKPSATYIVMSLMHGGSLAAMLRARATLPLAETVGIVTEVAATLDRLHARGITHRGLTPGNILFDFSGRACIADIGVTDALLAAGALDASLTPRARAYAAPEQWRSPNVDGRADQYSLALIAHEMLTGEPPRVRASVEGFRALEPMGVQPDVPLGKGVPLYVNGALRKALSAATTSRFATASDFAQALAGAAAHRVTAHAPPPPKARLGGGRRVAAVLGAIIVVLAVAAAADRAFGWRVLGRWRFAPGSTAQAPAPSAPAPVARPASIADTITPAAGRRGTKPKPVASVSKPRASAAEPHNVAVVSAGAVVDAPRRATAPGDTTSPPATLPAAATPPREPQSWLARFFGADAPPAPLPPDAYIRVTVDRGSALVSIDGIERGTAPLTAFVNAGHHTVAVRGSLSYTSSTAGVVVARRDTIVVSFRASTKQ